MKHALALAALAGLASCGLDQITVTLEGDATLSSVRGAVVLPDVRLEGLSGLRFTGAPELAAKKIAAGDIDGVQLEALSIAAPEGEDLDRVDFVEIFLAAPGQTEVNVAQKHVPDGTRVLELDVQDDDLAVYAQASSMSLRAAFQLRKPIAEDLHLHVKARFRVAVTSSAF
jgi:hypothetical protein